MELISPQGWALIHLGMIFLITCALLLVVYILTDSSSPSAGLGLYTVYFMAALLGWIAYTLQQVADVPMTVDVPAVASILNGYILFIAAGQRAESSVGRVPLAAITLAACFSVFFLSAHSMFIVQSGSAALLYTGTGILAVRRAHQRDNAGDAIIAFATLLMTLCIPIALYQFLVAHDQQSAESIVFGAYSSAYVLVAIGFLASVVIEYQQHLSQLTTRDPLTRLLNLRGLESALRVTLAQAERQQSGTAAIMVDIDQLKEVNDNFGYDVGDQVIRRIAGTVQQMCRGSDAVARTGGEEFLLVLPQTSMADAKTLAERIRVLIAERPLVIDNHNIPITVSMGVALIVGDEGLDKLSREATRAMHLAKHSGSNRVASVENKPVHITSKVSQE